MPRKYHQGAVNKCRIRRTPSSKHCSLRKLAAGLAGSKGCHFFYCSKLTVISMNNDSFSITYQRGQVLVPQDRFGDVRLEIERRWKGVVFQKLLKKAMIFLSWQVKGTDPFSPGL